MWLLFLLLFNVLWSHNQGHLVFGRSVCLLKTFCILIYMFNLFNVFWHILGSSVQLYMHTCFIGQTLPADVHIGDMSFILTLQSLVGLTPWEWWFRNTCFSLCVTWHLLSVKLFKAFICSISKLRWWSRQKIFL